MPNPLNAMSEVDSRTLFEVSDYNLAATLTSGQAFRWTEREGCWEGVIAGRFVRLSQDPRGIVAETAAPVANWRWLHSYLDVEIDFAAVIKSFPEDEPMRLARESCKGLRLLRQEPWECLASFILSSTKQIVQIQQIVDLLSRRFGEPIPSFHPGHDAFAFPTWDRLASASENSLRECKMGFRAPYLHATARRLAEGKFDLESLKHRTCAQAREELVKLPGVGPKIADCVLLFGLGFPDAFPVDVWVQKALQQLYFPRRKLKPDRLRRFVASYFGPYSGYAQQYLFHHIRTKNV